MHIAQKQNTKLELLTKLTFNGKLHKIGTQKKRKEVVIRRNYQSSWWKSWTVRLRSRSPFWRNPCGGVGRGHVDHHGSAAARLDHSCAQPESRECRQETGCTGNGSGRLIQLLLWSPGGGWKGVYPVSDDSRAVYRRSNMIGLFGLKSPTKDVGVTGALALMSIVLIEFSAYIKKAVNGF